MTRDAEKFMTPAQVLITLGLKDYVGLRRLARQFPGFPHRYVDDSGSFYISDEIDDWGEQSGAYDHLRSRLPDADDHDAGADSVPSEQNTSQMCPCLKCMGQKFKNLQARIERNPEAYGAVYKKGTKAERKRYRTAREQTGVLIGWKHIPDEKLKALRESDDGS